MKCNKCGYDNVENSRFCSNCGNDLSLQNSNVYYTPSPSSNDNIVIPIEKKKSKLFGFRSGKTWKKVLAVLYLICVVLFLFGIIFTVDDLDVTAKDKVITRISYFFMFLAASLPYIWLCDFIPIKNKLIKNGKKAVVIIIAVVLAIVPMSLSLYADTYKSDEYKAAYEQQQKENGIKEIVIGGKSKEEASTNEKNTTEKETTTHKESTTETTTKQETITDKAEESLSGQFESIGLTSKEAKSYAEIFDKLGIKEISNIEIGPGTGIDELQSFRANLYDYKSLQVNFTVENRELCYVEIAGLPSTKSDFYIGMFGKLKTKQVQTTTSVSMYDKWDNNGDIDNNKNPYLAVFDYESQKISEYTE